MNFSIFSKIRSIEFISLMVDGPVRHPMHASADSAFRASLFLPASNTAILDAARTVMQPATSKQRALGRAGGRTVRRSLLGPRFPLVCPRVTLLAAAGEHPGHWQRRRSYKVESSATTDTDTRVRIGCCEDRE